MIRAALLPIAMAVAAPTAVLAQEPPGFRFSDAARADYPDEVRLGTGPGQPTEEWFRQDGSLQVRNVTEATLTPFLPNPQSATGAAVVVAPGGGFLGLAIEEEGFRVARWLADHGIAAFVLKYRVLPTPADPRTFRSELVAVRTGKGQASFRPPADTPADSLADGQAALRHVMANAKTYGIDPARTGMMGFSAGAMLTLSVTRADDPRARPAFVALIYGRANGDPPPAKAPPMFALVAADDPLFGREGFGLIESWRKAGAPVEFHLLQTGGHGFGLGRTGTSSSEWIYGFHRWLDVNGMLTGHP
ncbi:alpha/beta hydrolase [Blastomonas sp. AAP53]|uniref:alpha/beta hydrolase n=1 Tax=Blastomonas sp. AAP53 TaxID=1248760 RepID=UPI00031E4DF7|nr:alpha/beta hydrolase [Blastomonas sp. AAP53]